MSRHDRTESCYQKRDRAVTLLTPIKDGVPIRVKMTRQLEDGTTETISRREYKKLRRAAKAKRGNRT